MLGFGSSARRGATGWTDRARVRSVIDTCRPDRTIDGASPAGGADHVFFAEAVQHFFARGLDVAPASREPVDHALDGPWPAAGHRRNERMYRTWLPSLAAGFVSGKVGLPMSSGSRGMARICLTGRRGTDARVVLAPPCAVVIYREDGVEPHERLSVALAQLHLLREATGDERLVVPCGALDAFWRRSCSASEVLAALAFAADGSRWAPWIEAVEATVRLVF